MFKRKEERERTKLEIRVSKLPTADLVQWAEQALYGIGRSLSTYQRSTENEEFLDEAVMGAEALHVVLKEVAARHAKRI